MSLNAAQMHGGPSPVRRQKGARKVRLLSVSSLDGRTLAARRLAQLITAYTNDTGGDPTTAEAAIIRRAASIQLWCEHIEGEYGQTGEIDIAVYTTAVNGLRRLLADLGIERRQRDVTPSLHQYLAQRASAQPASKPIVVVPTDVTGGTEDRAHAAPAEDARHLNHLSQSASSCADPDDRTFGSGSPPADAPATGDGSPASIRKVEDVAVVVGPSPERGG